MGLRHRSLQHRTHKTWDAVTEFACRVCGSAAVVYPAQLSDDAPVTCRRCRTVLCTLREFRSAAEQGIARIHAYADGSAQTESGPRPGLFGKMLGRLATL
ncbi:MAG TPA: hypothetical protein VKW08_14450 [Xanthobacteraceae bacterium]|jgi:transcription elongation factor Elf1|nr:hypothetical protein [Xanthobacteraceae bacterium]